MNLKSMALSFVFFITGATSVFAQAETPEEFFIGSPGLIYHVAYCNYARSVCENGGGTIGQGYPNGPCANENTGDPDYIQSAGCAACLEGCRNYFKYCTDDSEMGPWVACGGEFGE